MVKGDPQVNLDGKSEINITIEKPDFVSLLFECRRTDYQ